jgi:hypothetical protein
MRKILALACLPVCAILHWHTTPHPALAFDSQNNPLVGFKKPPCTTTCTFRVSISKQPKAV